MVPSLKPNKLEFISYSLLLMVMLVGLYLSFTNEQYFNSVFTAEDGIVEWLTFLFLLSSCILLLYKALKNWSIKPFSWKFGIILIAILFLFAAGEEISWGQRIFNIESNAFFIENNLQKETNLHNLTIGNISINKLVFGKVILGILLIYILILPVAYLHFTRAQKLVDKFAIPIMEAHHVLAFIISTVIIVTIPAERKWELYELCFAFIFLMIFHNPFNSWIYKDDTTSAL